MTFGGYSVISSPKIHWLNGLSNLLADNSERKSISSGASGKQFNISFNFFSSGYKIVDGIMIANLRHTADTVTITFFTSIE